MLAFTIGRAGLWTDLTWGKKNAVTARYSYEVSRSSLELYSPEGKLLHTFLWHPQEGDMPRRLVERVVGQRPTSQHVCYNYSLRPYEAPEWLRIKVLSVEATRTRDASEGRADFVVTAEVQDVIRTASGVKPREVIRIRYSRKERKRPVYSGGVVPILQEGRSYRAFLKKAVGGEAYGPVGGEHSFQRRLVSRAS